MTGRTRRTALQVALLEQQILDVLREDHPQSVRHVFYRLTDPNLPEPVEKSELGYRHVQDRLAKMRRTGKVPYSWISDATRSGFHVNTFADGGDFLRQMTGLYRADLWRDCQTYVEVWCESRSIAGVIQRTCAELAVSLYPAGGFTSDTLAYQAADYIRHTTGEGERQAVVLYIGDYDPAGVLIDVDIEKKLRAHLGDGVELAFNRLAINPDQIDQLDLPSKPRKPKEKRAQHVTAAVEAEAMPANHLRHLLREAIEAHLPEHALDVARVAENSERAHLQRWARLMQQFDPAAAEQALVGLQ